jgi:hypothetical protein
MKAYSTWSTTVWECREAIGGKGYLQKIIDTLKNDTSTPLLR